MNVLLVQLAGWKSSPGGDFISTVDRMEDHIKGLDLDLIVFPELATVPYFCGTNDRSYFDLAEDVAHGRSVQRCRRLAATVKSNVVIPFFEKGPIVGEFFNSAAVLDRGGNIVVGVTEHGARMATYRKNHISDNYAGSPGTNEKFFFRAGPGFPTFQTDVGKIGILICYDRSFPESWRMLALQGVDCVLVPVAIAFKHRAASWDHELRTAAVQNGVFVLGVNKEGTETVEAVREFSGRSVVVNPTGEVTSVAENDGIHVEGVGTLLSSKIDLLERWEYGKRYHYFRDRRPEIYSLICER